MSGPGVYCTPNLGRLSIQGASGWLSMHTPAWNFPNLLGLWRRGDKGGADRPIAHAGSRAYPRRVVTTRYSIEGAICGEVNWLGVPYASVEVGLATNLAYLHDELTATPSTDSGTRAATLTLPTGVDIAADVHVLDIIPGRSLEGTNTFTGDAGIVMLATLELEIPRGGIFR